MPWYVVKVGTEIVDISWVHISKGFGFMLFASGGGCKSNEVNKVVANVGNYCARPNVIWGDGIGEYVVD
jgi:hypothetical protein